ncbi:MAG: hypothetical protein M1833_002138 [Piccolia ochrophora]|nr:MAG: hypothetical protein M1833_002138 [Piccolia ochrophora]
MICLFFILVALKTFLGDKNTKSIIQIVDIPASFALRYINIFFTPSFVLLPLSPSIGGLEVGKIVAVFFIGFVVMLATTAYFVRGLQYVLGTSKRSTAERAEEMGIEDDQIPLTETDQPRYPPLSPTTRSSLEPTTTIPTPQPTHNPSQGHGRHDSSTPTPTVSHQVHPQDPPPLTRPQRWAAILTIHLDVFTFLIIFLFIGIPVNYSTSYSMPAHLSLSILTYLAAVSLPARSKQFLHPVLVSSALTILGIWILALTSGNSLSSGLHTYSTKTRYLQLWHPGTSSLPPPGAGDVFSSVLDASIVALALPMFQYLQELKRHLPTLLLSSLFLTATSLLAYPPLCAALAVSPTRSLSFASRSLTLALATPATANLGGDLSLVAVLCITSGILGVLIGPALLKLLRIPEDDYVTRGVALGGNSSAIATALLLTSDPRAAALSSLSMSLFGTVMVALTSVPAVARAVGGFAGLDVA